VLVALLHLGIAILVGIVIAIIVFAVMAVFVGFG
jgi:hypothetical protein